MSKQIDERIVEMEFDNKQFEQGVSTTIKSLDKLKDSLNFEDSVKGFDKLDKAAKNTDVSALGKAAENVKEKFSVLGEIAIGALREIGREAINTAQNLIESLAGIDAIIEGFNKYEQIVQNTQTMYASTRDMFATEEEQAEAINAQMDKMLWYADETSYKITDLTGSSAKFFGAGANMDDTLTAVIGIGNALAQAGVNAQDGTRAYYNLSQAMGAGALKLQDWKSLEMLNMTTKEFKQTLIDTAVAVGTLATNKDGLPYILDKGEEFIITAENMRETLSKGWATTDVILGTFGKYGEFTEKIYKHVQNTGIYTTQLLDYAQQYAEGTIDWTKVYAENATVSADTINKAVRDIASGMGTLGYESFRAAQEAITFTQAIDATKDAVTTGWARTWDYIFGSYKGAKKWWSSVTEELYSIFVEPLNERNKLLEEWQKLEGGGRDTLLEGIINVLQAIKQWIDIVKQAWNDIFPSKGVVGLAKAVAKFKEFTEKLKLNDVQADKLKRTFKGLFSILKIFKTILKGVIDGFKKIFEKSKDSNKGILDFTAAIGDGITKFADWLEKTGIFSTIFEALGTAIRWVVDRIKDFIQIVKDFFSSDTGQKIKATFEKAVEGIKKFIEAVKEFLSGPVAEGFKKFFDKVHDWVEKIVDQFIGMKDSVSGEVEDLGTRLENSKFVQTLKKIWEVVKTVAEAIWNILKGVWEKIKEVFSDISKNMKEKGFDGFMDSLKRILEAGILVRFIQILGGIKDIFKNIAEGISVWQSALSDLTGVLEAMTKRVKAEAILKIAIAVGILAVAIALLGYIDWQNLVQGLIGVGAVLFALILALNKLSTATATLSKSNFLDTLKKAIMIQAVAVAIILFAGAIAIVAGAMKKLASIDIAQMGVAIIGLAAAFTVLYVGIELLLKTVKKIRGGRTFKQQQQVMLEMLELVGIMLLLTIAINRIVKAMEKLAKLSWGELVKGLVGLAGVFVMMGLFMRSLDGVKMSGAGKITLIAAGLGLFLIVMKGFIKLSWSELAKGLASMAASLLILCLAINAMSGATKGALALALVMASLIMLIPIFKAMASLSWGDLVKGLVAIAGALAIFVVAGYAVMPVIPGVLALGVAFSLLGVGLLAMGGGLLLASLALESITRTMLVLSMIGEPAAKAFVNALTIVLTGLMNLIPLFFEKFAEGIGAFLKSIGSMAVDIGEAISTIIGVAIKVLTEKIPDLVEQLLVFIVTLLTKLADHAPEIVDQLFRFIIEVIEGIARNLPELIQALVDVIMALFQGTIDALGTVDKDVLLKGIAGVGILSLIMAQLAAIGPLIPLAMVGAAGMVAVITEFALLLGLMADTIMNPDLLKKIEQGGEILQAVGTAIGKFIGGLIGGTLSGITSELPAIATDLSKFAENLAPFAENMKKIDSDVTDAAQNLATMILTLSAANLLDAISGWIGGESMPMEKFAAQIVPLGKAMAEYSEIVSGNIDAEAVAASANAGLALAELARSIPRINGVAQFFAGTPIALDEFGAMLKQLGTGLAEYSDTVKDVKPDAIESSANAAMALAEVYKALPRFNGVAQWFAGSPIGLDQFGAMLKQLGDGLAEYSFSISGVRPEAVEASANALKILAELNNSLPKTGGVAQWFTGNAMSLSSFGDNLKQLGQGLAGYMGSLEGVSLKRIDASGHAMEILVQLANALPKSGGITQWFTGTNTDFASFASGLKALGSGLKDFYLETVIIKNPMAISMAAVSLAALCKAINEIPTSGGISDFLDGSIDMEGFGKGLVPLGKGIASFSKSVVGITNFKQIEESVKALIDIAELNDAMPKLGGISEALDGRTQGLDAFGTQLGQLGLGLKLFATNTAGINLKNTAPAVDALIGLASLYDHMEKIGGIVTIITGETMGLDTFGDQLGKLGSGLARFVLSTGLKTLDYDSAGKAVGLVTELASITDSLPKVGGMMEEVFGGTLTAEDFTKYLIAFGIGVKDFAHECSLVSDDAIPKAQALAGVVEALSGITDVQYGGFLSLFTGDEMNFKTFAEQLPAFGEGISSFATSVADVEFGSIDGAKHLMSWLINDIVPNVGTQNGFFARLFSGDNSIGTFGNSIKTFGEGLKGFYDAIVDIDASHLGNVIYQIEKLADLALSTEGTSFSSFSGLAQALSTLAQEGINNFLDKFDGSYQDAKDSINNFVYACIGYINDSKPEFKAKWTEVIDSMIETMKSDLNLSKFQGAGIEYVNRLKEGLVNQSGILDYNIRTYITDPIISGLRAIYDNCKSAGEYLVDGFVAGLNSDASLTKAYNAGWKLADQSLKGIAARQQSKSPSKEGEKLGDYLGIGFVNGILDNLGRSEEASTAIADAALQGMSDTISQVYDAVNENIDSEPVITPVLDLSDISTGVTQLDAMLSRDTALGINAAMGGGAFGGMPALVGNGNTYNFTQINNSPKALSRIDIYRQTKNMFSNMERMTST